MTILMMMTANSHPVEAFWGRKKEEVSLTQAEKHFNNHEYYFARQITQQILEEEPENQGAQELMGKILDAEIERHKNQLIPRAIEEMNSDEKSLEVKTWMERSRALFAMKEYDLALFAAEKIFLFDADSMDASELIDTIKEQAIKEGKADILFLNKMYEEEISDRLEQYQRRATTLAAEGHFGEAKYTTKKILLLEPEDPQAHQLFQNILEQEEAKRYEPR